MKIWPSHIHPFGAMLVLWTECLDSPQICAEALTPSPTGRWGLGEGLEIRWAERQPERQLAPSLLCETKYIYLSHFAIHLKLAQYCKSSVLQLFKNAWQTEQEREKIDARKKLDISHPEEGPHQGPARLASWPQIPNLQNREKYIPAVEKPPTLGYFVTAAQADWDGWPRLSGDGILEKRLHFKNYWCF